MRHEPGFDTRPFLRSRHALRWLLLQADGANISAHRASPVSKARGLLAGMILAA
jgi:hypothetical protein